MRVGAHIHRPVGPLAGLVDCIWLWQGYASPQPKERVLPSGTLDLVINLRDDRLRVYDRDDPARCDVYSGTMISGATSGYLVIHTPPIADVVGVHFKPGGAAPFLGIPAGELEDGHASLDALWGTRAGRLRERLLESPTRDERIRLIEAFLLERASRRAHHPDVALALAAIEERSVARVAELCARTGLSAKRLIALFRDEVGMAPKTFWRIRRFQAALRDLRERARSPGASGVATDLGYFDQAHMIRDFRAFTGFTPRTYLRLGVDRPNHVPHPG